MPANVGRLRRSVRSGAASNLSSNLLTGYRLLHFEITLSRLRGSRSELKEFKSSQQQAQTQNGTPIPNTYSDTVNADLSVQNTYSNVNGYASNGHCGIPSSPMTNPPQATDVFNQESYLSNQYQQQQYMTSSYQSGPENVLNNLFTNGQSNVEQSGSSLSNKITTAATEKAAQISQQINHLLQSNFDYTRENHSRTPSEATTTLFAPSEEANGREVGGVDAHRSASHLSLPNSWQGNTRSSASTSTALVRELQQRNVELAALLEQRNEGHDRVVATIASLRDQLHRLQLSSEDEKRNLEVSTQRELAKARDQVRAHSQTVGALVAAKTELEAKLAHLERAAEARSQEVQSLTATRNEARAKLREAEDALQLAKSAASHSETAKTEALTQLEQWRMEAKREKDLRRRLEVEVKNREEKMARIEADMRRLILSNEDLGRQLDVAMAFSKLGSVSKPGTPVATVGDSKATVVEAPCTKCDSLKTRIHELETTEVHISAEKARLESQYKAYVADIEMQVANLRSQLEKSTTKSEGVQRTLEDFQRKLTVKESELTEAVSEVERLRNKIKMQEAASKNSDESTVHKLRPTKAEMLPIAETDVKESVYYKDLELTNSALKNKVNELSERLSEITEELSLANARVADRETVLATATSERTALSRAMEQNAALKDQLTHLQDALSLAKKTNEEAEAELAELRSKTNGGKQIVAHVSDSDQQAMWDDEKKRLESALEMERKVASDAHLKIALLETEIADLRLKSIPDSMDLEKEISKLRGLSERQAEYIKSLEESQNNVSSVKDKALVEANALINQLQAQIDNLHRDSESDVKDLKRQLSELRSLSERQAQHIVTMDATQRDQITEREKELNEAKLKIAELEGQLERLGQNSDLATAELNKKLAEITALSKCQAEQITLLESSQSPDVTEKMLELEEAKSKISKLEAQVQNLQQSSGHEQESERVKQLELEVTKLRCNIERQEHIIATWEKSAQSQNKRDAEVVANVQFKDMETSAVCQTEFSLVKSEEILHQLRSDLTQSKADYVQLEERFKQIVDRLSASDEEKSKLEGVIAQLEMESSTIGEYITLFAHRRQLMSKRARIRDALLARLIRDRRELRQRLQTLAETAQSMIVSFSQDNGDQKPSMIEFERALTTFLSDLDTSSGIELDAQSHDSETESTDTDTEGSELGHKAPSSESVRTLDAQLREYVSAVHDCPHCECCSGSLLVV
nr:Golgin subfamily A [Hymenolepis microstoma]